MVGGVGLHGAHGGGTRRTQSGEMGCISSFNRGIRGRRRREMGTVLALGMEVWFGVRDRECAGTQRGCGWFPVVSPCAAGRAARRLEGLRRFWLFGHAERLGDTEYVLCVMW